MTDSRSTIPKIHAILVGINVYAEQRSLKSAVKDAEAFKKVLENLDSTDLTLLLDVDAKHDSIMTALESLQYKDGLTRDDAIVFFFSGYAGGAKGDGQEDSPKEEEKEGPKEVGMICPTDFMEKGGISDQMLVKLFDRISKACGNNITVFLDCPSRTFNWGNPSSFVAVTPLDATETANGGAFTQSLCKILADESKFLDLLTVRSLADKIEANMDSKVECYGRNVDRLVFNPAGEAFHAFISCDTDHGNMNLGAGFAHGVKPGTIYAIYRSNINSTKNRVLTYLVVSSVEDAFSAKLSFIEGQPRVDFKLPIFYAVAAHIPDEGIKINLSTPIAATESFPGSNKVDTSAVKEMLRSSPYSTEVDKPEDANMTMELETDHVRFLWKGLEEDRGRVQVDTAATRIYSDVNRFKLGLKLAARFHYHLSRPPLSGIAGDFEVQLYKVKERSDGDANKPGIGKKIPITDGRFSEVALTTSESCQVCLTLENNTEFSLWSYVFIFDPKNFAIYPWYSANASLPPKGKVTVGFGDEGCLYFSSKKPKVDLSYIKVFVTTRRTTFALLQQHYYRSEDDTSGWIIDDKDVPEITTGHKSRISHFQSEEDIVPLLRSVQLAAQWTSKRIAIRETYITPDALKSAD